MIEIDKKMKLSYLLFEVRLSFSEKIRFICFNEKHLRMMKIAFYFVLKAVFVFKIFKFLF